MSLHLSNILPGKPPIDEATALRAFVHMIWRRRGTLIFVVAVCVGLGAAYLLLAQPIHKVTARLLVQPQQPLGGEPRVRNTSMEKDFIATQAEVAKSPVVIERAVTKFKLTAPDGPDVDPVVSVGSALSITPVLGTNVLTVSFQSPNRQEGLRTVESIITCYREYLCGIEQDSHSDTLKLLTRSEKELRDELAVLETKFQKLRENSTLMGQGKEAGAVQAALLTHLGQTLSETKNRRIGLENQLRVVSTARRAGDVRQAQVGHIPFDARMLAANVIHTVGLLSNQPASAPVSFVELPVSPKWHGNAPGRAGAMAATQEEIASIQVELSKARVREQELAQAVGPRHPDLRGVREQIATWEKVLAEKLDAVPETLKRDLNVIRLYETELTGLYDAEFRKAKETDGFLLKEQQALDEIQRVRTIHDSILTQLKQREIAEQALVNGRSVVTVNLLESPVVAERPAWPPSPLWVLTACSLVGLLGGIGLVSLIDRTETAPDAAAAGLVPKLELGNELQTAAPAAAEIACPSASLSS